MALFFLPFLKLPTSEHFYHQAAVQVCCFGAFLHSLSNRVCVCVRIWFIDTVDFCMPKWCQSQLPIKAVLRHDMLILVGEKNWLHAIMYITSSIHTYKLVHTLWHTFSPLPVIGGVSKFFTGRWELAGKTEPYNESRAQCGGRLFGWLHLPPVWANMNTNTVKLLRGTHSIS